MNRRIYCEKCGVMKPMPIEDVVSGFTRRQVRGASSRSLLCDMCDARLAQGTPIVAETIWNKEREGPPRDWEREYLEEK